MTSVIDFRDVLREACSVAGSAVDARTDTIIEELYTERLAIKAKPLMAVDPRILRMLKLLRAGGIKLGIISNCSVEEVASWSDSPLASLFDSVVFSYRVGMAKPQRAIYLHACRTLDVTPHRVAFVGDGGSDELAGADAAGLTAYRAQWFLDQWPAQPGEPHVDHRTFPVFGSVDDLTTILPETY